MEILITFVMYSDFHEGLVLVSVTMMVNLAILIMT